VKKPCGGPDPIGVQNRGPKRARKGKKKKKKKKGARRGKENSSPEGNLGGIKQSFVALPRDLGPIPGGWQSGGG